MNARPTIPELPQFGHRIEGRDYIPRPSVYAVITDETGRFCTIEEDGGLHLPGGGIDPGETPIAALHREIMEETGMQAEVGEELGRANEYVDTIKKKRSFNKLAVFYRAEFKPGEVIPPQYRSSVRWMTITELEARATHRMYAWIAGQIGAA